MDEVCRQQSENVYLLWRWSVMFYHYCKFSFNKTWTKVLRRFKYCLKRAEGLYYTVLLNIQDSIRAINKTLSKTLREVSFWHNANKISLNIAKTDIILFKTSNKIHDIDLKIVLRKRIPASPFLRYVKYVFIDENLIWKTCIYEISTKLIKGNAMLSKLRHFVNK